MNQHNNMHINNNEKEAENWKEVRGRDTWQGLEEERDK